MKGAEMLKWVALGIVLLPAAAAFLCFVWGALTPPGDE